MALAQLPLNLQLQDDATFKSFYPANNIEILTAVMQLSEGVGEKFIYLWGLDGSGRSHLLQAACRHASLQKKSAVYIPLHEIKSFLPEVFQDLESLSLVCIDDIEYLANHNINNAIWEETIFHLFNRIQTTDTKLLIAGDVAAKNLPLRLLDLKSRLSLGMPFHLQPMNDEQKLEALILRAHCRGLELNRIVGQFLLSHCPRDMAKLFATLEQLDKASLAEQRRLTIPFVKHVLSL